MVFDNSNLFFLLTYSSKAESKVSLIDELVETLTLAAFERG